LGRDEVAHGDATQVARVVRDRLLRAAPGAAGIGGADAAMDVQDSAGHHQKRQTIRICRNKGPDRSLSRGPFDDGTVDYAGDVGEAGI